MSVVLVAVGGALGACLRFWLDGLVTRRHPGFPWGTLVVNVLGSFVVGVVLGLLPDPNAMPALTLGLGNFDRLVGPLAASQWRLMLATGFCGALTTYSTFAWQTASEIECGRLGPAVGNVLLNVLGALVAVFAGLALGTTMFAGFVPGTSGLAG